jgi:hypothetical protein
MSSSRPISKIIAVALAASATAVILTAAPAEAQRGSRDYYFDRYDTGRQGRGFEGFRFPGSYCSYRRFPKRVCTYDKRGREVCKVKGWTVEQFCD